MQLEHLDWTQSLLLDWNTQQIIEYAIVAIGSFIDYYTCLHITTNRYLTRSNNTKIYQITTSETNL